MPPQAFLVLPIGLLLAAAAVLYLGARAERGSAQRLLARRAEQPLAHELPYWEFLDHDGAGVLVHVDHTYSLVLELEGIDTDCLDDDALVQATNAIHGILQNVPVGTLIQLLYDVDTDIGATVSNYRAAAIGEHLVGRELVQAKVDQVLRLGGLRRCRLHAVVSLTHAPDNGMFPGNVGAAKWPTIDRAAHEAKLRGLLTLGDQVMRGFAAAGVGGRTLTRDEARELVYAALNPERAALVAVRPWAPPGTWAEEQTAREQLALTSVTEGIDQLALGHQLVRVITLRSLSTHTYPGLIEQLQLMLTPGCRMAVAVEALDDLKEVAELKRRRDRAGMLARSRAKRDNEAEAQYDDVDELIDETLRSSVRSMRIAVSVVLTVDGTDSDATSVLDRLTAEVLRTCSGMNGAQALHDTHAQLDEWRATLPGNSRATKRWRRCTSKNAAHMLPAWQSWNGAPEPLLLLQNGRRNLVGLDPFWTKLDNLNAFIAGVAGSGKSTTANYQLLNLIATGAGALVVDIGGSYRRIIEIFGGKYFAITDNQSLNPFFAHEDIVQADGSLEPERARMLLAVLERMLCDVDRAELRNGERAVLGAAVVATYQRVKSRPPLLGDLQAVLSSYTGDYEDDTAIARRFAGDLRTWVTGPAARIINRQSTIPLTTDLAAFDLKGVEGDPALRDVVMLTLAGIIWNLLDRQPRGRRKIVVFDEVWRFLMTPASAKLLEELYRTSRKYRASIVTISQSVEDFLGSSIATALINNSATCYFLRHQKGHEAVAQAFDLNEQELRHFRDLRMVRGKYSEALVLYGPRHFIARVMLSPLEYWIATTHPPDLQLEAQTAALHPRLSRLELLKYLASHHPAGAPVAADAAAQAA